MRAAGRLAAAVEAIADGDAAAPAPEISEETQRLLDTDSTGLDAELVGIYLTEADEVLETIDVQRHALDINPGDREALRTVRRQFHTLKGSGRMVGLAELGELAFSVEKISNRLLEDDRAVTPAVIAMIGAAEKSFRDWVAELRQAGRVRPDPTVLHAAIRAVEMQLPGGQEIVVEPLPEAVPEPVLEPAALEAVPAPVLGVPGEIGFAEVGSGAASAPHVVPVEEDAELAEGSVEEILAVESGTTFAALPEEAFAAAEAPPAAPPASGPGPEPDEITIGDVTVSMSLFRILVDEAEQHLATLRNEFEAMRFEPASRPPRRW